MTTTPAAWEPLETALRQRRPINVTYHGRQRLICPHALGWNNTRPLLLAYQTGGDTTTGTLPADPRHPIPQPVARYYTTDTPKPLPAWAYIAKSCDSQEGTARAQSHSPDRVLSSGS
jgi:hypothetical protein